MILTLDFETTFQIDDKGRTDPSPYDSRNKLVSAGWFSEKLGYQYKFYYHTLLNSFNDIQELQEILNNTTLLICHNAKFELSWITAIGLKYEGKIACCMIREYVLAKGQKLGVSLKESCLRNEISLKKSELVDKYLKQKIGFEVIEPEIVEEYGLGDIKSTWELYNNQLERLKEQPHLWPTIELMEEFCVCLADIETNGIKIDTEELDRLDKEYKEELTKLQKIVNDITAEVMGDTKVNLDSPEQLSQVIFSRQVIDKPKWKEIFNLGTEVRGSVVKPKRKTKMSDRAFADYVIKYTKLIPKTRAVHCTNCDQGYIYKIKVNGKPFSKPSRCPLCFGEGFIYLDIKELAGLKQKPVSSYETAVGGFSTDRATLERLMECNKKDSKAHIFLSSIIRIGQIHTYLDTFIEGIRRGIRGDNILHPSFMQCVTATGRLSSRNPNFQNQPRGNTFPVRKAVISRFKGGTILSADFRQLEFRIAGELSGDEQVFKDITDGIDVHAVTAKHTGHSRQDAKSLTFAPVYGATELGKPKHIARYFIYFKDHYKGIYRWHNEMGSEIIKSGGFYRLPSGREYYYPNTIRYKSGTISNSTIIANYPVQGFATADIAIIASVSVWRLFKANQLKSLVILQVHDDVTCDVFPGEEEIAAKLLKQGMLSVKEECLRRYKYDLKIPIEIELKSGINWLQQKEV